MNIFEKINEVRVKLQNIEIKKSGKNQFAGYSYHELRDFSDSIQVLNKEVGLFSCITMGSMLASIRIYDTEKPSEAPVEFCIEVGKATLKGAHEIQNRGAEVTYMRRYLYMLAYDITEHDAIDSSKPLTPKKKVSDEDKDFYDEIMSYSLSTSDVVGVVKEFGVSLASDIKKDDRKKFLSRLKFVKTNQ